MQNFNAITKLVLYGYLLFTGRKRSLGKVFSVTCVKNSVHGGGGALPQCMLGYHTPPPSGADTPSRADTPPSPRRSRHPLPLSRHPPPGTPLCAVHAGRYGQQAGGMHPTGMQSCSLVILAFHVAQRQIFTQIPVGLRVN